MLANFFGKSKPSTSIIIIILYLLLYFLAVFVGNITFQVTAIPFFFVLFGLMNFIDSKNDLTFDNSYAFLFFVLLIALFYNVNHINITFYGNFLLLVFLRRVYSLQSPKKMFQKLFDAGLWLGITFLIEPFTIIFFLFVYVAVYLHQQITGRTILIPILGFATPVFLFFTYCFWYDKLNDFYDLFYWFTNYDFSFYLQKKYVFAILFSAVFTLLSVLLKTPRALSVKNTFRGSWVLVLLNFILSVVLLFLIKEKNGSELLYVLFPTSIILANGLELYQKKWISNIVLVLFFTAVIIVNFL